MARSVRSDGWWRQPDSGLWSRAMGEGETTRGEVGRRGGSRTLRPGRGLPPPRRFEIAHVGLVRACGGRSETEVLANAAAILAVAATCSVDPEVALALDRLARIALRDRGRSGGRLAARLLAAHAAGATSLAMHREALTLRAGESSSRNRASEPL